MHLLWACEIFLQVLKIFLCLEHVRLETVLGLVRSFSHFCDSAYDEIETVHTTSQAPLSQS